MHSLSRDGVGRDKSGHRKNPTKQGALTLWRRHQESQVRTRKGSARTRGTHILETASGGTSQDTERIRPSEMHSRTGDGIRRDKSGHGTNPTELGALTNWRRHRERQVRTREASDRVRGTHSLETASGGTSQDTEGIRPSDGHSHPRDGIGRDKSVYGKNVTERGALTNWRRNQEGQVRTRKESDRVRGTYFLETAPGGTSQDIERIWPSEGHSHSGDSIVKDKSGHGRNPTERWALTSWRRHRERQVRTREESDRARGTHSLETALGGTSQDTESIRPSDGHSLSGDGIGRDKSGHGKHPTELVHSLPGDGIRRDKSGHRNNPTERGALTLWRRHWEGQVTTRIESDRVRGTHSLETASGGTSLDMERIRPSEVYSPPGYVIGRDKSGHRKNPTERGVLTLWRRHRKGQVRTRKASHRARRTHILEMASGGTSQATERIRPSDGHSLSGDDIGRNKSGHGKNLTERGARTS